MKITRNLNQPYLLSPAQHKERRPEAHELLVPADRKR